MFELLYVNNNEKRSKTTTITATAQHMFLVKTLM